MGGASAPTLSFHRIANRPKSIGPEGPSPRAPGERRPLTPLLSSGRPAPASGALP
ncbi:DUF6053 domain-containing protein [Lysobacter enzymogenes]|uniref:DUF6053 domain-containing protein n=1 Tax=Lysobacter enzymogenes TaxID=69 RepID=UPI003749FC8A